MLRAFHLSVVMVMLAVLVGCVSTPPGAPVFGTSVGPPSQPNLLVNGSMEAWHSSGVRARGWGLWTKPDYYRFRGIRDEEHRLDGQYGLGWESDVFVNAYSGVKLEAGKTYTLSASVWSREAAKVLVKFSLQGPVPKGTRDLIGETWELPAGEWTRVHVTGVMPDGTTGATAYFCFGQGGRFAIDQAMVNAGELQPYVVGREYEELAEVGMTPTLFGADGSVLADQSVVFAFDDDMFSHTRLSNPDELLPKRIGVGVGEPVLVRGVGLFLGEPVLPEGVTATVMVSDKGVWRELPSKVIAVGPGLLFSFDHTLVHEGIRIDLTATDGGPVTVPKIYNFQLMQ